MGAALQRNLQNMRRGGGSAPPDDGHRFFTKMSFRGAKRRGNPFSRASQIGITDCHTSDVGHWFAMTIFWGCGAHRFAMTVFESTAGVVGASGTPPPTECGAGGRGRTPPLRGT